MAFRSVPSRLFAAPLTCVMLFSIHAFGQTGGTGAIAGTIVDSTGAVIPGATITATNVAPG